MPPAILYLSKYRNKPEKLLNFFQDFDRLASGLMIMRANVNQRIKTYGSLLYEIEDGEDLQKFDSALQLTNDECQKIINCLNYNFFDKERTCRYILLRLDTALSEGGANYNFPIITIEHILPQNSPHNSQWLNWFPTEEQRLKYTNCLGDLVLLSRRKNQKASNFEFEEKKHKYFSTNDRIFPFVLTTQVLTENEWTPEIIERRQQKLLEKLK
ncbi:HNH endonuclease family protein [Dapis sp. BLCC M126]|uniref:HNH endonuclease family protein n=1 Tax=Dapis sp. BLCC M126 TaxID=3400189 RepID=UPI003CF9D5F3